MNSIEISGVQIKYKKGEPSAEMQWTNEVVQTDVSLLVQWLQHFMLRNLGYQDYELISERKYSTKRSLV
jgi:hypothetical protein